MASPGVGADIEDTCARCGESWHVVMAKMGDRIAKVVCKRCGSQHNYRGGSAGAAAAAAPEAGGATTGPGGRRVVRRKFQKANEPAPIVVPDFDPSKPPRPYSAREAFGPGERIIHPSFGTGVVASSPGPGKVDVVFPEGARTLACAKAESTLTRPTMVDSVVFADRPPDHKV